jgi:hypothetical protein
MMFCAVLLFFGTASPNAASLSTMGYNQSVSPARSTPKCRSRAAV